MTILPFPFQFPHLLGFFCCLIAVTRTSNTMLNRNGESRQSLFCFRIKKKGFYNSFHCWVLYCCGFVINIPSIPFWWEMLSWMDVEFYQMFFLHLLRWSCGFHIFFCWCAVPHWLICVCWTICLIQGWIQLGYGVWSFFCVAGFATKSVWICNKNVLSILYLYSSKTLACDFLSL